MRSFSVEGPFGLHITLKSRVPGTLSLMYTQPDRALVGRSSSEPHPTTSTTSNPLASHTQSEVLVDIPGSSSATISEFDEYISLATAPSPAPTEIIPCELTQAEAVEDIQRRGIKVRDFAYEPVSRSSSAYEVFDPLLEWDTYERTMSNRDLNRPPISGKTVSRLLHLGWLNREDEMQRWNDVDRESLKEFESRPIYPWKPMKNAAQPKKEVLSDVLRQRSHDILAAQLAAEKQLRAVSPSSEKKRAADDTADSQSQGTSSPSKKRKTFAMPNAAPSLPPTLINGRPPKQFPAGNPSDPASSPPYRPSAKPVSRSYSYVALNSGLSQ